MIRSLDLAMVWENFLDSSTLGEITLTVVRWGYLLCQILDDGKMEEFT